MRCIVCGAQAQSWDFAGGGMSVDCVDCSRFDVSGSVLAERAANGYRFDVDQTRLWLASQRLLRESAPLIETGTVRWGL